MDKEERDELGRRAEEAFAKPVRKTKRNPSVERFFDALSGKSSFRANSDSDENHSELKPATTNRFIQGAVLGFIIALAVIGLMSLFDKYETFTNGIASPLIIGGFSLVSGLLRATSPSKSRSK